MDAIPNDFILTKPLPFHGWCFVCGKENPHGIGLIWQASFREETPGAEGHFSPGSVLISSDFHFKLAQQGPPGHAHGGASAAVIDEAMGASVWQSGYRSLLAHYELDYKLPVPLNTPVRVEAWVEKVDGRKIYARGHLLLADGRVAVTGTGLYLHIPGFFEANT
jgi:acyl-coenzyme A thioesterase PaaI-like protein